MKQFRKVLYWLTLLVLVCIICVSAYQIWDYFHQSSQAAVLTQDLVEHVVVTVPTTEPAPTDPTTTSSEATTSTQPTETAPIIVDFGTLKEQYEDVVGWIYCPDTIIHYPIAQGDTNSTYLRRLLDGSYNSNGSIFLDYRNSSEFTDENSVIYGHNMHTDAMFGTLSDYQEQAYYDAHPVMYLLTPDGNFKLKLLAGSTTDTGSPLLQPNLSGDELQRATENFIAESDFLSVDSYDPEKGIITLVTCEYDTENSRYLLLCQKEPIA